MRYLGTLLLIGFVVYCVIDIVRSDDDERLGVHPALWVLLVVLFPIIGGVVWLAVSRTRRGQRTTYRAQAAAGPAAPVAPDDDPEFLWRLEQERRRREARNPDDEPHDQPGPTA
ncbi:PLD nuclease N-terminal domain-containing protein [Cellulomonas palmilytica]|uniref:PLD nuclease N-terminal domain-containing protein n=1 Tax=Cellulomonas palmilytica TaxID=2608402 RepID=UPI001F4323F1|nr:PLD nuclease N-terminal domain-containing protein [Cellulomonas palmilytica]UJP39910.1 PLDc_N domain-containing protein [Cellulomonas palmilytica]